jgi:CubicO group peptidase (beta-lactamase class C family)
MLTQHSGIPGELLGPSSIFTSVFHPDYNARAVDYLRGEHAQYPTDYFFAYSNTAVGFLADVVAVASGMSFLDYSNAFLRSLGMNHSSFNRDDPSVAVGQTKTYGLGQTLFDGYVNPLAAGSILSSVSDMAKYIKMIHAGGMAEDGHRVLRPNTFETMLTPQNLSVPLDFDFRIGFMWWLVDPDLAYAGRVCQHGGDTLMSHTQLEILRDHKLGVVVLTNTDTGASIKNKMALKALQLALEDKADMRPPAFVPEFSPPASLGHDRLDALAGIYIPILSADAPLSMGLFVGALSASRYDRIDRSGDGLAWTQDAGSLSPVTLTLVPRANGRFSIPGSQETEYGFETVSGQKVMLAYHKGFRSLSADRYDPVSIPPLCGQPGRGPTQLSTSTRTRSGGPTQTFPKGVTI